MIYIIYKVAAAVFVIAAFIFLIIPFTGSLGIARFGFVIFFIIIAALMFQQAKRSEAWLKMMEQRKQEKNKQRL